jgi:hypothetical protein
MGLAGGMCNGLGNVLFGIKCSATKQWGAGFAGPLGLVLLVLYRIITQGKVRVKKGTWVDRDNSNWYEIDDQAVDLVQVDHLGELSDETLNEKLLTPINGLDTTMYRFKYENMVPLSMMTWPSFFALIVISYGFEFAIAAGMN